MTTATERKIRMMGGKFMASLRVIMNPRRAIQQEQQYEEQNSLA